MAINLKSLLRKTTLLDPSSPDLVDKSCPVCLETYLQNASNELPRRLPCGHVVGTECLFIWAAEQASTREGVKCPWCRRVVVDKVGGIVGVMNRDVEQWVEVLVRFLALCLAVLAARYLYDDKSPLVCLWAGALLLSFVSSVCGIGKRPRCGAVLMLLGLCVRSQGGWWWLGQALLDIGRVPFNEKISKAYKVYPWRVSGVVVVVWGVLAGVKVPGGAMLKMEAKTQMLRCAMFWITYLLR